MYSVTSTREISRDHQYFQKDLCVKNEQFFEQNILSKDAFLIADFTLTGYYYAGNNEMIFFFYFLIDPYRCGSYGIKSRKKFSSETVLSIS